MHPPYRLSNMRNLAGTLAALLLCASCAATEQPEIVAATPGSGSRGCSADGAFSDLTYGMPTYDYDRQETLDGLIDSADLIIQGAVIKAEWISPGPGVMGWTVLTIVDPSPLSSTDEALGQEITISYGSGDEGNLHPLTTPKIIDPPAEVIAFMGPGNFNGHREVLLQGVLLRCSDEQILSIIEPLPRDAASFDFFELVDTLYSKVPPPEPRPNGPTRSIPYRLLAEDLAEGMPWSTGIVTPNTPGIDANWDTEVVFEFNPAESGSCPFGLMEDLRFDELNRVLFPVVPLAEDYEECTDDANPHLIRVAIQRDDLPTEDFSLWVNDAEPPSGVVDGVTQVKLADID